MKVLLNTGEIFQGTAHEIVTRMNETCWYVEATKDEYMKECAARAEIYTGEQISTTSPKAFLYSLESVNLLAIEESE